MYKQIVKPITPGQALLVDTIKNKIITICDGPAGSGKTTLAVAHALEQLDFGNIEKIIITRPAVEAEEKIGSLPGSHQEKVAPYMQPIFDAFHLMVPKESFRDAKSSITVEPMGFLRGRTFKKAFIILDEAQNTTPRQMKLFLTRLGEGSKMVVVGDSEQSDIKKRNGLSQAIKTLAPISRIGIVKLTNKDIVRHDLISEILEHYTLD